MYKTKKKIMFIPPKIDFDDLNENGKLLSDDEIKFVQENIKTAGRIRWVGETKLKYAVFAQDGEYFAVYKGDKFIGKGSYGKIKIAQNLKTGEWVVLKVQKLDEPEDFECDQSACKGHLTRTAHQELNALTRLHRMIVTKNNHPVFLERRSVHKQRLQQYLLMKYVPGRNLETILQNGNNYFSTATWVDIVLGMIDEVAFTHRKGFLHRDIKLSNFHYDIAEKKVTLLDYGFAHQADVNFEYKDCVLGTTGHLAPEICDLSNEENNVTYTEKTEVYALGVTLAVMFKMADYPETRQLEADIILFDKPARFLTGIQRQIFDDETEKKVFAYIKQMISPNPLHRPNLVEAKLFFNKIKNGLKEEEKIVTIGLLDVKLANEILASWSWLRKENFFRELRSKYHLIRLYDSGAQNKFDYARLWTSLTSHDIHVDQYFYPRTNLKELIKFPPYHVKYVSVKEPPQPEPNLAALNNSVLNKVGVFANTIKNTIIEAVDNLLNDESLQKKMSN